MLVLELLAASLNCCTQPGCALTNRSISKTFLWASKSSLRKACSCLLTPSCSGFPNLFPPSVQLPPPHAPSQKASTKTVLLPPLPSPCSASPSPHDISTRLSLPQALQPLPHLLITSHLLSKSGKLQKELWKPQAQSSDNFRICLVVQLRSEHLQAWRFPPGSRPVFDHSPNF